MMHTLFTGICFLHSLDCPKIVEQCPVRGCGQHFRKGEMQVHKKEKLERHISLMESERTGILWQSAKVGQKMLFIIIFFNFFIYH